MQCSSAAARVIAFSSTWSWCSCNVNHHHQPCVAGQSFHRGRRLAPRPGVHVRRCRRRRCSLPLDTAWPGWRRRPGRRSRGAALPRRGAVRAVGRHVQGRPAAGASPDCLSSKPDLARSRLCWSGLAPWLEACIIDTRPRTTLTALAQYTLAWMAWWMGSQPSSSYSVARLRPPILSHSRAQSSGPHSICAGVRRGCMHEVPGGPSLGSRPMSLQKRSLYIGSGFPAGAPVGAANTFVSSLSSSLESTARIAATAKSPTATASVYFVRQLVEQLGHGQAEPRTGRPLLPPVRAVHAHKRIPHGAPLLQPSVSARLGEPPLRRATSLPSSSS